MARDYAPVDVEQFSRRRSWLVTTVGLFGFGRIGRNIFRILYNRDDIRVGAISDLADPPAIEYLVRFDTILGRFPDLVSIKEDNLYVVGRQIPVLSGKDQPAVPNWSDLGFDVVFEATNIGRTRAEAERHLAAGARRVVLMAPPKEPADVTIVMTVHAYSSAHRLTDVPAEDMRRGRAAPENIIPQESRSPARVEQLLPELAGRLSGFAMNVPVRNGSVVDLV